MNHWKQQGSAGLLRNQAEKNKLAFDRLVGDSTHVLDVLAVSRPPYAWAAMHMHTLRHSYTDVLHKACLFSFRSEPKSSRQSYLPPTCSFPRAAVLNMATSTMTFTALAKPDSRPDSDSMGSLHGTFQLYFTPPLLGRLANA